MACKLKIEINTVLSFNSLVRENMQNVAQYVFQVQMQENAI